jgi:hypothetical protein
MKDRKRYGEDAYRMYYICFITGTSENLPLWFLYSGANFNGARITVPQKAIRSVVESSNIFLVHKDKNKYDPLPLARDKDCSVTFRDIVYVLPEGNTCRIKHNDSVHNSFPTIEFEQFKKEYGSFDKGLIWFYEKETRMLVEVREHVYIEIENHDEWHLEIELSDKTISSMNFMLSPLMTKNELDNTLQLEGIKTQIARQHTSLYTEQILLDLDRWRKQ